MRLALQRAPLLAPWFWGVNGAASVCASVLAVVIAIGAGISAAFWTGTACYAWRWRVARRSSTPEVPTSNIQLPTGTLNKERKSRVFPIGLWVWLVFRSSVAPLSSYFSSLLGVGRLEVGI